MGKKVDADPPPGAPDWIVTFADMISLLVTFFILLMTFSSMEAYDAFQADGDLTGTTGTVTEASGPDAIDPPDQDRIAAMDALRGAPKPHLRPSSELLENIEDMGQKKTDEDTEIDLKSLKDGIVIRFDERSSFKPGSTALTEHLRKAVIELGRTLENYPYTVVVEGHTDDRFQATEEHRDEFVLSAARASAVIETMLDTSGINPRQLQLEAVGSAKPAASNETPEGRQRNRRIEVRVVSLSQARAAALTNAEPDNG